MRPGVDKVDLYSIRELAPALPLLPDATWWAALCDPSSGISYKANVELLAQIISNYAGSGVVIPDRVYRIGVEIPDGSTVGTYLDTDGSTKGFINDPYLDGKVYSVHRRGVELMVKGSEWDNDQVGKEMRLLQFGDIFQDGDIITAQFQPQINTIISSPDSIARFTNGVKIISSNTLLTASDQRKLLLLTGGFVVTLDATYPENVMCAFTQNSPGNGQSTIVAPIGQTIYWNGSNGSQIWVGKNERISFIRVSNIWYVVNDNLGYDRIGHIISGRLPGANQLIAQGQQVLRSDFPRVVDYLNRLNTAYPGVVLSAANWATNKTFWGFGNGTTTIQVPDLRGYFPRWLDLGANVDIDRNSSNIGSKPGSGQGQQYQSHTHAAGTNPNQLFVKRDSVNRASGVALNAVGGNTREYLEAITQASGGSETRPINVGELPLIFV